MRRPFRFGAVLSATDDQARWLERCRLVEKLGYDAIGVVDHLGGNAPLPALVAASAVTGRVRLGTYVLNTALYPPALLARDVLTAQRMTGGRLEAGLGAGYDSADFERASVPWATPGARVSRLATAVAELGRHDPPDRPVLMVGGSGKRLLRLAAEHGDIVAFSGTTADPAGPAGRQRLLGPEELAQRVRFVAAAGPRAAGLERNLLLHKVVITNSRQVTAEALHRRFPQFTVGELLDLPTLLIGTVEQIVACLVERRERFGFSYLSVHEQYVSAFAPVVERLAGR